MGKKHSKPVKKSGSKDSKKQLHKLSARAKQAAEAGDYFLVREINNEIIGLASGGEAEVAAKEQNNTLDFDPFLLKFGAAVVAIYSAGWLFAFFH